MTFPFGDVGPVAHGAPLPEACDLVVIGGGVIGVCTALYATRKGLSVVLLEKRCIAAEQSSRNRGWIRVQGRGMAEIPVAAESLRLWSALEAECRGRLGLKNVGISNLARDTADLSRHDRRAAGCRARGGECRTRPGLIAVTGMSGHGFGAGPRVGRIAADLAAGDDPGIELWRFRVGRHRDGTRLRRGPKL